jgi:hypothetical protein
MTPAEKQAMRERCERVRHGAYGFAVDSAAEFALKDLPAALDEIDRLEARLAIDQPNPFLEGYDAIDLLNDRVKALEGENERLRGALTEIGHCKGYPGYCESDCGGVWCEKRVALAALERPE